MTLREYLDQTRMPVRRFAAWIGVNPQTVWAWLRGDRKPKLAEIERIYRITDGAIRPEDWIERVVPRPVVATGDVAAFSGTVGERRSEIMRDYVQKYVDMVQARPGMIWRPR